MNSLLTWIRSHGNTAWIDSNRIAIVLEFAHTDYTEVVFVCNRGEAADALGY